MGARPRPLFLYLGGLSLLLAVVFRRNIVGAGKLVVGAAKKQAFNAVIPPHTRQYTDIILKVAAEEGVSPFIIVALMEHESASGFASPYVPKGSPAGTGDFVARAPGYKDVGPKGLPPDGLGWGRGLMQLDYSSKAGGPGSLHYAIVRDGRWREPYWNIKAAISEHLKPDLRFFSKRGLQGESLLRAALAAYNTGAGNVWNSIQTPGKSVDSTTTHGNYSAKVYAKLVALEAAFKATVG